MHDTVSVTQADIDVARNNWNAFADEFNQWHTLSLEEQAFWQLAFAHHRLASTQPAPAFPREEVDEAALVAKALSIATYGQPAQIAVQVATNAVRVTAATLLQGKQP